MNFKSFRKFDYINKAYISFAPFNTTNISSIKTRFKRKCFL